MKRIRLNAVSIITKLIVFLLTILLIMTFVTVYSNLTSREMIATYNENITASVTVYDLYQTGDEMHTYFKKYFVSPNEANKKEFEQRVDECDDILRYLRNTKTNEANSRVLTDVANMIASYLEHAQQAVDYKIGGNSDRAYELNRKVNDINNLISRNFATHIAIQLEYFESLKAELNERSNSQATLNIILIIVAVVLSVTVTVVVWRTMSKPINQLARNAREISSGNLDVKPLYRKTKDEFFVLINAFNDMVQEINYYMMQQKEKAEIEYKLHQEEMNSLKMKTVLRETQFRALRSQMNPHFLFNTLSIISQTCYMEEAYQSLEILEATIDLMRYYLNTGTELIKLRDEMQRVNDYILIQKLRFADKIAFEINIDERYLDYLLPALSVQPAIENAIQHGLHDCLSGGKVTVSVGETEKDLIIEIADNGIGISEDKIHQILTSDYSTEEVQKDVEIDINSPRKGGIGLKNIRERFNMLYNKDNIMDIQSELGVGTKVILHIPKRKNVG